MSAKSSMTCRATAWRSLRIERGSWQSSLLCSSRQPVTDVCWVNIFRVGDVYVKRMRTPNSASSGGPASSLRRVLRGLAGVIWWNR